MSSPPDVLQRLPEARTYPVRELVDYARQGRIRVPRFQRKLNWQSQDVLDFFDSIYRGLPVGSLLFWKHRAEAGLLELGPLHLAAPELADAWWVVDGQQRVTSLAASLLRPLPLPALLPRDDPFVVYFDAMTARFEASPRSGEVPPGWVPLPVMLDATQLTEWVYGWSLRDDRGLRARVFEAGTRIRDYMLPSYLVETSSADLLREIFFRVNKTGKRLEWEDVHDALYGHTAGPPSTIVELSRELEQLGMGQLKGAKLINCLMALRGLDITRSLAEHRRRDPDGFRGAVADALPVLNRVLIFLKNRASIPHLRLLPRPLVLEVLTRFFAVHPQPGARTLELLVRWVWRIFLGDARIDERTLQRRAVIAVTGGEEDSVQTLLELAPRKAAPQPLPAGFDARTAGARVAMVALAFLVPRELGDEHPLDISALIQERGANAFGEIISNARRYSFGTSGHNGPENRILHPGTGPARQLLLERIKHHGIDDPILQSHAIGPEAADALSHGHIARFLQLRRARIEEASKLQEERLAAWGRDRDRPSIDYLLSRMAAMEQ